MRFGCILLTVALLLLVIPAGSCAGAEVYSGVYEGYVTWEYDPISETLTISGEGKMEHRGRSPWDIFSGDIKGVIVEEGITNIPGDAFDWFPQLQWISLPDGLVQIGDGAFEDCESLERIDLPSGLKHIGKRAFKGCTKLETVKLPAGLKSIGTGAFEDCTALRELVLPKAIINIPRDLCEGCTGLERVVLPRCAMSIGDYAFADCENLSVVENYPLLALVGKESFSGTPVPLIIQWLCVLQSRHVVVAMGYLIGIPVLYWLWNRAGKKAKRFWGILLGIWAVTIVLHTQTILIGEQWQTGLINNGKTQMAETYRRCAEEGGFAAMTVLGVGIFQYFVGGAWLLDAKELPKVSAIAQVLVLAVNLAVLWLTIYMAAGYFIRGWEGQVIHLLCIPEYVSWTPYTNYLICISGMILGWAALILARQKEE